MCPVLPFLTALLTLFLCCLPLAAAWSVKWQKDLTLHMDEVSAVNFTLEDLTAHDLTAQLQIRSENYNIADVNKNMTLNGNLVGSNWSSSFNATGVFLGSTNIYCQLVYPDKQVDKSSEVLPVKVIRKQRVIDHIFTGGIATLVSILYINFGAAVNWGSLGGILRRPIGPAIGFVGQFLFMPLISYALGHWLFMDSPELALGLFFTGISPAGGASNIWTCILGGNVDLSITMTTISTLAAFGMMPFWVFTLGKVIFNRSNLGVPYTNIATFAIALIIPLAIGYCIQRFLPRVARVLVRILKPLATLLILFIIIFATVTNLYLFELFSWQIVVAGLGLPWLGYCAGWLSGKAFRQPAADVLAIAVEVGIQNTGIAIFLLRFSLEQPAADLTTVIPVAVAIMTPLPLLGLYIYQKIRSRCRSETQLLPTAKSDSLETE